MKKRELKNLDLNKKCISNLENVLRGGAIPTYKECPLATGCVGPPHPTCGIVATCTKGNDQ
ncbi:hypothetical protein [Kordia sp.]|uniref:hypothetical protein n=1 Tax=Kordia sp. TaxID=1965332 RepID=UPI003D6B7147